ncbi:MAG: glutaredoxin family protein [Candidatus Paceibacterota bacterium]
MSITIYVKTGCPWCKGALDFLQKNGMEYTEKNVTDNPEYMKEMVEISKQEKAPTLVIDGEVLADYSADELDEYLKGKGLL